MFKVGEVVSRNVSAKTVRVKFPLFDDTVSSDLVVVQRNDNWMPNVGEQVLCGFSNASNGHVIGVV